MSTLSQEEKQKLEFHAICARLCENDGATSVLDLSVYGVLGWKEVESLCDSLDGNTRLCDLTLVAGEEIIGADALLLLIPFLRTCTSLQKFRFTATGAFKRAYHTATDIILNTISYSASLTKIALVSIRYARPELLEKILSKTQTLKELEFSDEGDSENFSEVCQSLRRGFQHNRTLEGIKFTSKSGPHVEEALFGMFDLAKLASLTLDVFLTGEVSNVLRCSLKGNETLQSLNLTMRTYKQALLAPVLLGLAYNRGIEDVQLKVSVTELLGASAWTELFQQNQTIKSFTLCSDILNSTCMDRACATAVAVGLCDNASLQKLFLVAAMPEGAFDGAAWQNMIQTNHSFAEINLRNCSLGKGEEGQVSFKLFTLGLSRNTSLKTLDLSANFLGSAGGAALADAFAGNETLQDLLIRDCELAGEAGQAVIRKLWSNKGLRHLDCSENCFGGSGGAFAGGLPNNKTLRHIDFDGCEIDSEGCRTILESLHGNTMLEELLLYNNNNLTIGGSCATALTELLECTPVRKLDIQDCQLTSEGMPQLTDCLRGNTCLQHLDLSDCGIENDGLLQLAEALVQNSKLSELRLYKNAFGRDALCRFLQLLPGMKGLQFIQFDASLFNEALGLKLVEGLRVNKSLETICGVDESNLSTDQKVSINLYLEMNRNGRKFLQESQDDRAVPLPTGAWPLILAKMTASSERDQLFHFLRKKGDLVQFWSLSRKRKASAPASIS